MQHGGGQHQAKLYPRPSLHETQNRDIEGSIPTRLGYYFGWVRISPGIGENDGSHSSLCLNMLAILKLITREFLAALSPAGAARQHSEDVASRFSLAAVRIPRIVRSPH